jgi:hypothetical protein
MFLLENILLLHKKTITWFELIETSLFERIRTLNIYQQIRQEISSIDHTLPFSSVDLLN